MAAFAQARLHEFLQLSSTAVTWTSQPVHKQFFPFPLVPVLHAARISMVFQTNRRRVKSKLTFAQDMAGYLIMCWGGAVSVNMLLGLPPPQLVSSTPWIIYPGVHVLLSILFSVVSLPDARFLDTALPLVDAVTRSAPICGAIEAVRSHPNELIRYSLTAQIISAAVASAGGSTWASALGVWEPTWHLTTPAIFGSTGGLILPSIDAWAGALAGMIYGAMTLSHPTYARWLMGRGWRTILDSSAYTPLEARAAAVAFLAVVYAYRAASVHYLADKRKSARRAIESGKATPSGKPIALPKKDL